MKLSFSRISPLGYSISLAMTLAPWVRAQPIFFQGKTIPMIRGGCSEASAKLAKEVFAQPPEPIERLKTLLAE